MNTPRWVFAFVVVALCALVSSPAAAQFPDLVDMSVHYMPKAPLAEPQPVETQLTSYEGSVFIPLPLGPKTFLIPGLAYHADAVSFANAPTSFIELRAFHSVELPLLFVQLLPHDWALAIRVAPGIAGDFAAFDGGLFRMSAVALGTHSFSDELVFGGGAMLSYSFGSLLPLPALYLEWKPLAGLQFETFLPAFVAAKYTIGERVELGVRADIAGNSYGVRDRRVTGTWPCTARSADDPLTSADETVAQPSECLDHVAYSGAFVGVTAGVRLFETVWLTAFAGHSVFRRYQQMNDDDEPVSGGVQSLPNDFFVRVGLTWRLPRGSSP